MNHWGIRNTLLAAVITLPLLATIVSFAIVGSDRYGDNLDSYAMLGTWQQMVADGTYVPSRFQGNLFSELTLGYLASVFGPVGSNGLSLLLSALSLVLVFFVFRIVESDPVRNVLALATIIANPFWLNASVTSMDYIHPIPFFLAGVLLLHKRHPVPAAVLFAIAGGIRISYAPLGLGALGWTLNSETETRQEALLLQSMLVFLVVIALNYLPAVISSHLQMSFIDPYIPAFTFSHLPQTFVARPTMQGFVGLIARWVYKSIYLYGLIGTAAVVLAILFSRHWHDVDSPTVDSRRKLFGWLCIAVIAYHSMLFLYIPVRIEYLLPVLIAMAGLFLVRRLNDALLVLVVVSEISYWFVSVDLLEIRHQNTDLCAPVIALGAAFRPHLSQGILVHDLTGKEKEVACLRNILLQPPADIRDRLPTPAVRNNAAL